MYEADRSIALTRVKQRVCITLFIAPANFALNVALSRINDTTVYLYSLFREIITPEPVFLILVATASLDWAHSLGAQICAEVLNFKFYAAQFDYITFAKFIV